MNKIVEFNLQPRVSFKVRATTIELFTDIEQNLKKKKHVIVVLQNLENKREVIHPITDFIYSCWKYKEYNSMASAAYHVVAFLNWIFFCYEERINSLCELKLSHAIDFLFYLTNKGNQKKTVQKYERTIQKLYKYLYENGILQNISNHDIENMEHTAFKGVIYNNQIKGVRLHDFKRELLIPFIETAYEERNLIALGVYYQIFGGVRVGEVVNIRKSAINNIGSYGEFGQIIKLEPSYFRDDIVSASGKGEIKKDRNQVIFPYKKLLKKLYKNHIEKYKCKDSSGALFVNTANMPMTGESYDYHFNVLKRRFIERLLNSSDMRIATYGRYLDSMKWSTHIGRGLYSNLMAEYTDNILEVAVARGDSDLKSSLPYMANTQRIIEKLQDELELLYTGDFLN